MKIRIEKDLSWMAWAIIVILVLGFGLWAGYRIKKAIADVDTRNLEIKVEEEQAELAEAQAETEFWKSTLKILADGDQRKEQPR
jgi:cell division protein FtsB